MAATPHAEVVINEPAAPPLSGYIPCKVSACGSKIACPIALHDVEPEWGLHPAQAIWDASRFRQSPTVTLACLVLP